MKVVMALNEYAVMVRMTHLNNTFCNYIIKVPASEKKKAEKTAITLLSMRQDLIGKIKKAEIVYCNFSHEIK